MEYGSPLSAMAVFFVEEPSAEVEGDVTEYRLTAVDVFAKRHRFQNTPEGFVDSGRLVEMFQVGGAEITARGSA